LRTEPRCFVFAAQNEPFCESQRRFEEAKNIVSFKRKGKEMALTAVTGADLPDVCWRLSPDDPGKKNYGQAYSTKCGHKIGPKDDNAIYLVYTQLSLKYGAHAPFDICCGAHWCPTECPGHVAQESSSSSRSTHLSCIRDGLDVPEKDATGEYEIEHSLLTKAQWRQVRVFLNARTHRRRSFDVANNRMSDVAEGVQVDDRMSGRSTKFSNKAR